MICIFTALGDEAYPFPALYRFYRCFYFLYTLLLLIYLYRMFYRGLLWCVLISGGPGGWEKHGLVGPLLVWEVIK